MLSSLRIVVTVDPDVRTKASILAVPFKNKSLNWTLELPKSTSLSVTGTTAPSSTLICSVAVPLTSIKNPTRLLAVSTTILFKKSWSPIV